MFDIDNTLMEPTQTLGSDQWFYHQKEQYVLKGMTPSDALEQALSEWMSIQSVTKVKVVEPGTKDLVRLGSVQFERATSLASMESGFEVGLVVVLVGGAVAGVFTQPNFYQHHTAAYRPGQYQR